MRLLLLISLFTLSAQLWAAAEQKKKDDVDYLSLAALLVRDKHFDRAEQALKQMDLADESVDKVRYYTLFGLVFLNSGQLQNAVRAFEEAIAAGQTDPVIYVYMAQAYYVLKNYKQTIEALGKAGVAGESQPQLFVMKAESYWQLNKANQAWLTNNAGITKFPVSSTLKKQNLFFLVELGLYEALESSLVPFLNESNSVDEYLWIGNALRQKRQAKKAARVLEQANLRFPSNEKIMMELANAYLDQEKIIVAAAIFEDLSLLNSRYSSEASELYRRANKPFQALVLNGRIDEQQKKLKQRLAILLELENFDLAAAMAGALFRTGLLEDQDIRYALAYSLFKTGNFAAMESHLKQITRPDLFRKSTELRRLMEECTKSKWACI